MKNYYFFTLLAVILIFQSCTKDEYIEIEEQTNLSILTSVNVQSEIENQLFELVNQHRVSMGLNLLQFESNSYFQAQDHNEYMISKGVTSHANFDSRAKIISSKTGAQKVSENVAKDYDTAKEAFNAWLTSSGHRKNIEGNYTHSALSISADARGNLYFTQIFIR